MRVILTHHLTHVIGWVTLGLDGEATLDRHLPHEILFLILWLMWLNCNFTLLVYTCHGFLQFLVLLLLHLCDCCSFKLCCLILLLLLCLLFHVWLWNSLICIILLWLTSQISLTSLCSPHVEVENNILLDELFNRYILVIALVNSGNIVLVNGITRVPGVLCGIICLIRLLFLLRILYIISLMGLLLKIVIIININILSLEWLLLCLVLFFVAIIPII